jgi:hypothetical protein
MFKKNSVTKALWRISIDSPEPERLPPSVLEEGYHYLLQMSPNGKWIAWRKSFEDLNRKELWIYDVSTDQASLLSTDMYSYVWSADGSRLACVEATGERVDGDRYERLPTRLVIYDLASGKSKSISLGAYASDDTPMLVSWAHSGERMLFRAGTYERERSRMVNKYFLLPLTTGEFIDMPEEVYSWLAMRWLSGEKIMWIDKNRIVTTKHDGSDPRELFRIEDGKFYLYGEEQSL